MLTSLARSSLAAIGYSFTNGDPRTIRSVRVKHDRVVDKALLAVNDEPARSIELATTVIDSADARPVDRIRARWARGMALRESGELSRGAEELFAARQEAVEHGDPVLAARIDTTLAAVALYTGSADGALEILEQARPHLRGADLGRLETQRGLMRHRSGDVIAAIADYRTALRRFDGDPDPIGRIRVLQNLGLAYAQRGELRHAEECFAEASQLADAADQRFFSAAARHNLGYARSRAGRLAAAFEDLSTAHKLFLAIGRRDNAAFSLIDLADVLLQAQLTVEAADAANAALDAVRQLGNETELADAALLAARCRLAAGRLDAAREAAAEAAASFRRQHRSSWEAMADYVHAAIEATEHPSAAVGESLWEVSRRLDRFGWSSEAAAAQVRAGQLFLAAGAVDRAADILGGLRVVSNRPAGEQAAAYLARGLLAEARNDRPQARAAVRRGLRVVADNQTTLGALEFRTLAAGHGEALVTLGARLAVVDRQPTELLHRVEATRQMVWLAPRATPPSDDVLARLLADLRAVTEDLRAAIGAGADPTELRRRRLELEGEIRDHTRRAQATGTARSAGVHDAVAALGDHLLLEYAAVDGELYAVTVAGGRARLHELGPSEGLAEDVDACTFALHRLNRTQGSAASKAAARATLVELGARLARRLLPERARRSDRPLAVVPVGALHGLAWAALPGLRGRPVSITPSLVGWSVAREAAAHASRPGGVLLAAGPELPAAPTEVESLASLYRQPTVLVGDAATAEATLHSFGRSRLAHLACHGSYRADNPLFSTLSLADGPLTVYDLERCRTMPRTVVLSACSVAVSSVLRGGTLLGLASALMAFGASTIIAPLTPVNDEEVASVMVGLHRAMVGGAAPAAALAGTVVGDPGDSADVNPTAAAFVAIGA
jgi:tetratricopeptide (TPR) repeat protein